MDALSVLGITPESAAKMTQERKKKGRRDARVCVCGHAGGAHFPVTVAPGDETRDIETYGKGEIGCQAGRTPCDCENFQWVLTAKDVRSFIQKTEGPAERHALTRGVVSAHNKGVEVVWREGLVCFLCAKSQDETGPLIPIPYDERGREMPRTTATNRLHCQNCRDLTKNTYGR